MTTFLSYLASSFVLCGLGQSAAAAPTPEMIRAIRSFRSNDQRLRVGGECERLLLEASELLQRPMGHGEIAEELIDLVRELNEPLENVASLHCFAGPMLVQTIFGQRPIAEIRRGDVVYSFDLKDRVFVPNRVNRTAETPNQAYGRLVDLDRPIDVTPDHRFLTAFAKSERDYRAIGELDPYDSLFARCDRREMLRRIPRGRYVVQPEPITVHEISLEGAPHNYFVEGILVHNVKDRGI